MKIIDPGHKYALKNNGELTTTEIIFYKDEKINGDGYSGTTNQEVIRSLIDRIKFLDEQKNHPANKEIIFHLRKALALHEIRHIDRCVEDNYPIEDIRSQDKNDHFIPNKKF